jgi:hypothetical protein
MKKEMDVIVTVTNLRETDKNRITELQRELNKETDKNRITELRKELNYEYDIERQNEKNRITERQKELNYEYEYERRKTEKCKNYKKLSIEMLLNVEIVKGLKDNIPHLGEYYDLEKQEYRIKYRGGDGYDRNITYNRRRDDIEIYVFGDYERIIIEGGKEFIMNWLREKKLKRLI